MATLVPPFDNGANAAPVAVQALSAVQALMLADVAFKQPTIECWTLCVSLGMTGGDITLSYYYYGDYPTRG